MNQITKAPTVSDFLESLRNWYSDIIAGAEPVAQMLVAALDVNPNFSRECIKAGASRPLMEKLELLGRGQIIPELLEDASRAGRALLKLPKSEQEIAWKKGVEVLEPDGGDKRVLRIHELTASQASQVFNCDHIRSLAEQRTYLASKKQKEIPRSPRDTVSFTKEGVTISQPGKFTWEQVTAWQLQRK